MGDISWLSTQPLGEWKRCGKGPSFGRRRGWSVYFQCGLIMRYYNQLFFGWARCSGSSSAISTILFSPFTISNAAFALGVISLLSSLIAIGFGVGMTYVLGDVPGTSLHVRWIQVDYLMTSSVTGTYDGQAIGFLHTKLYIFALSVPQACYLFFLFFLLNSIPWQVWSCVSFIAFFASISVIVWEATNKGWFVRVSTPTNA